MRAVLQIIADFTGLNIVTSDSIQGTITLKLEDVPWDQALDYILKTKGLGKRNSGNVLLIAPNEEITSREQLELESIQQASALAALRSEYMQINYAKAEDVVNMLKDSDNTLLSSRGQVSFDERTNTLLVKETPEKILTIKKLLEKMDVPVRQVSIEAQIVVIKDNFSDALGLKLTGSATPKVGRKILGIGPNITSARTVADDPTLKSTNATDLFMDFSDDAAIGRIGFALAKLAGGTLLDLELQASEAEDKSRTIARPKLMTLDQQTAIIETGQEIPYVNSSDGNTTVTFKKAVVKLEVTPSITPNDQISMELNIAQDKPGNDFSGTTGIDTTSIQTTVLVDNGETVVLGGVFSVNQLSKKNRIPYLSKIPFLGKLFTAGSARNERTETIIFITPRIVKEL